MFYCLNKVSIMLGIMTFPIITARASAFRYFKLQQENLEGKKVYTADEHIYIQFLFMGRSQQHLL